MFTTPKAKKELFLASSLVDGVEDNNIKQVTTLLDSKEADPNVIIPIYGITPFHLAIGNPSESFAEEVTKLFLRHGGNPNIRSKEGLTPVHIAAAWGRCKVLELLLANGGDPLYLDNEGYNPFHFAFDGVHYDAVSILRKYCGEFTNDDEGIKYDITLEKLLINNKNMVAEYVVSDDQTTGTFNISPENVLEVNIKSQGSSSDYQILLNDDFVTHRRKNKNRQKQKKNELSDETISAFKDKTLDEEKLVVSQLISHLSTSFSTDFNKTDGVNNSDSSLCEKRMRLIPTPSTSAARKVNQSVKRRDEYSGNLIRDRLKSNFKEEPGSKVISSLKSDRRRTKSPLFKRDKAINVLDNSVISKSPNCNVLTRLEKKRAAEKSLNCKILTRLETKRILETSPLVNQSISLHATKTLNNSIITKSPNCGIFTSDKKRKFSKTSKCAKNVTPIKKPNSKIISRTPSELTSKAYLSIGKKDAQISKSLPRNFHNKSAQKQESPMFKKPVDLDKRINSSTKKKDTEESSGIYSTSSKMHLKNVSIKLEDCYFKESISNSNELHSTKTSESLKQNVSSSLNNSDKKGFNTSFENMVSEISDFSFKNNFHALNSTGNGSNLEYEKNSNDSRNDNSMFDSQVQIESNLSERLSVYRDNDELSKSRTRRTKESFITDDLTERSYFSRPGNESFVSLEEEYKYKDFEEGVILKERRLCVTPSCIMIKKEDLTSFYTCSTAESVSSLPQEMLLIDKQTLRKRLTDLGENPGPITNSTQRVYLKRLMKLEEIKKNTNSNSSIENLAGKIDTIKSNLLSLNWEKDPQSYRMWENKIFQEFERPDPSRKWREGFTKTCFNYLLLDSRITRDLPNRASNLSLEEKWETFLSAIFYIGKGKQSRPYAHLYDAFHLWVSNKSDTSNKKIRKILEIWNEKEGVVVLHLFHNTIPVEAYTREAAMIDAMGIEKLANCKGGEYYGKVATWTNKEKCELGKYLLYKAMEILMVEGERHLSPEHL